MNKVIDDCKLFGITANDEILNIEFNRVKNSRSERYYKIVDIDDNYLKSINYIEKYSVNDFYVTDKNIDDTLDLLVLYTKKSPNSCKY